MWYGSYISRAAVTGMKLTTFFSNCTGIAARFCAVPMCATIMKILSWLTSFCAANTARLGSYAASSTSSLILRPLMPPCSLISSTRSIMPRRVCLPNAAIGPDKSWIVPSTISSLVTPCCCASAPDAASAVAATVMATDLMSSPG